MSCCHTVLHGDRALRRRGVAPELQFVLSHISVAHARDGDLAAPSGAKAGVPISVCCATPRGRLNPKAHARIFFLGWSRVVENCWRSRVGIAGRDRDTLVVTEWVDLDKFAPHALAALRLDIRVDLDV